MRSQEEPGGARRSQEEPGGAKRGQEEPGGARKGAQRHPHPQRGGGGTQRHPHPQGEGGGQPKDTPRRARYLPIPWGVGGGRQNWTMTHGPGGGGRQNWIIYIRTPRPLLEVGALGCKGNNDTDM